MSVTPWLLLAGFVYALMELVKAVEVKDWNTFVKRLAATVFGIAGAVLAAHTSFAKDISLGGTRTFDHLSVWDCVLLGPSIAGPAMAAFGAVSGLNSPDVVTTAAQPYEPSITDTPPAQTVSYDKPKPKATKPKVTKPKKTLADETIDKTQATKAGATKRKATKRKVEPAEAHYSPDDYPGRKVPLSV